MQQLVRIAQVVVPIFLAVFLGVLARRKKLLTFQECAGLQKFVTKFALPCVLFNSCLTADLTGEAVTTVLLVLPLVFLSALWAFRFGRTHFPYHNLPMLFSAQETGMLGIPLFIILFGADQAYKMGILDLTQAMIVFPVLAILSADPGTNPSPASVVKSVVTSPLMLMALAGLILNLTGLGAFLERIGVIGILTESTGFLSQPVSALMIFSVGYNFSLDKQNRSTIFRISGLHFAMYATLGLLVELGLLLFTQAEPVTRWSIVMYATLPASYLAPGLSRTEEDAVVASGVCSVLTVVCLLVFCVMAVLVV